jgi:hypothetical protein
VVPPLVPEEVPLPPLVEELPAVPLLVVLEQWPSSATQILGEPVQV